MVGGVPCHGIGVCGEKCAPLNVGTWLVSIGKDDPGVSLNWGEIAYLAGGVDRQELTGGSYGYPEDVA